MHLLALSNCDILHINGITAFILITCRGLKHRSLLWLGVPLLLFAHPLMTWLWRALTYGIWPRFRRLPASTTIN